MLSYLHDAGLKEPQYDTEGVFVTFGSKTCRELIASRNGKAGNENYCLRT
jgi:hypothetical protein